MVREYRFVDDRLVEGQTPWFGGGFGGPETMREEYWYHYVTVVVYYESRKRDLKIRPMNEGRYDERLKVRVEESTCLTYTWLHDKNKLEIPRDKDEVNE